MNTDDWGYLQLLLGPKAPTGDEDRAERDSAPNYMSNVTGS